MPAIIGIIQILPGPLVYWNLEKFASYARYGGFPHPIIGNMIKILA